LDLSSHQFVETLRRLNNHPVPIRWALVDDGNFTPPKKGKRRRRRQFGLVEGKGPVTIWHRGRFLTPHAPAGLIR